MNAAIHSLCAKCGQAIDGDSMLLTTDKKLYHIHCSPYGRAMTLPEAAGLAELLPCPFCGGKAKLWPPTYSEDNPSEVIGPACVNCPDCCVAVVGDWEDDASAAWNRRSPPSYTGEVGEALVEAAFGILWPQQEWNGEEAFCRAVAEKVVRTLAAVSVPAEGVAVIEKCLKVALRSDHTDAPFPLDEEQANIWHTGRATAFRHALEMKAPCVAPVPAAVSVPGE